jgi:exopolysaccharide biosynthesis polyprenyl glycosylphosphotransferase
MKRAQLLFIATNNSQMTIGPLLNNFLVRGRKLLILAADLLVLISSIVLAHLSFEYPRYGILPNESLSSWILFLSFIFSAQFVIFYIADLYRVSNKAKTVLENALLPVGVATLLLFSAIAVFCYWTKFALGRDVLLMAAALSWAGSVLVRLAIVQVFSPRYLGLVKPIRCFIFGDGPLTTELSKEAAFKRNYEVINLATNSHNVFELQEAVANQNPEIILIDSTSGLKMPDELIDRLVELKFKGVQVVDIGTFYEKLTKRVPLLHLPGNWFLNSQLFNEISDQTVLRAKRIFDLIIVLLLSPLALVMVGISCLIIKLTSPGKAIYSQERVGGNGQIFTVYKLRSMIADSEKEGAQWTQTNDPRITPFGKIIRSTRIDELPQLWNIFVGEMSLIGPRPERPEFVETLKDEIPYYDLRHTVRPGLTGWAQVNEPLATPTDSLQKLEFDLFYIRHLSFWLELDIILKTIRVILMRKGR